MSLSSFGGDRSDWDPDNGRQSTCPTQGTADREDDPKAIAEAVALVGMGRGTRSAGQHSQVRTPASQTRPAMTGTTSANHPLTWAGHRWQPMTLDRLTRVCLDRHPELFDEYFRHYRRLVYLAQAPSPALLERAWAAASFLKLPLEIRETGFGLLEQAIVDRAA